MPREPEFRLRWLGRLGAVAFTVLLVGLGYLQLGRGGFYREQAERNAVRLVPIEAPRGVILDRFGRPLATNQLSFDVALVPQETPDVEFVLTRLAHLTQQSLTTLREQLAKQQSWPFRPAVLLPDAPLALVMRVEEHRHELPGLVVLPRAKRTYPYGAAAAHVVGFIGPMSAEELPHLRAYGFRLHDWVGKAGVEATYDAYLRGQSGGLVVEVDNRGRQVRVLNQQDPVPGKPLTVTLDGELQQLIAQAFEGHAGACVVLEPTTGEVLALVSAPSFDPDSFLSPQREAALTVLRDQRQPLLNRAISGTYIPGSTFKLVTTSAALETGAVTPTTTFTCTGQLRLGQRIFHCWNVDGHGQQLLRQGLTHSCNVFFYHVGLAVGPDPLTRWAERLGLGEATGIDLPGEQQGAVPSRSWKRQRLHESWYEGDTANFAIGQGTLLVTPLQAARLVAAVANGGWLIPPHVVQRIGAIVVKRTAAQAVGLRPTTRQALMDGLVDAVASPDGTGHRAWKAGLSLAGKTGTAQTHRAGESHAWMIAVTPVEHPQAAVAVLFEFGGSGGRLPAQLVQRIAEFIQQHYTTPDAS